MPICPPALQRVQVLLRRGSSCILRSRWSSSGQNATRKECHATNVRRGRSASAQRREGAAGEGGRGVHARYQCQGRGRQGKWPSSKPKTLSPAHARGRKNRGTFGDLTAIPSTRYGTLLRRSMATHYVVQTVHSLCGVSTGTVHDTQRCRQAVWPVAAQMVR